VLALDGPVVGVKSLFAAKLPSLVGARLPVVLVGWARVPMLGAGADHPLSGTGVQVEVTAPGSQDGGFVGTPPLEPTY